LEESEKLKNKPFTTEEDKALVEGLKKKGRDWNKIAKILPQRNINMIKNRYYYLCKKKIINKDTNEGVGIYNANAKNKTF